MGDCFADIMTLNNTTSQIGNQDTRKYEQAIPFGR